jgi:hypothetical protein
MRTLYNTERMSNGGATGFSLIEKGIASSCIYFVGSGFEIMRTLYNRVMGGCRVQFD